MTASDSSRNPSNSGPARVEATQPGTRRGWWRSEITPLCLGSCEASQALAQVYAVAGSRKHPPPSTSLLGGGGPAGIVRKVEEGGWMSENLTRPVEEVTWRSPAEKRTAASGVTPLRSDPNLEGHEI